MEAYVSKLWRHFVRRILFSLRQFEAVVGEVTDSSSGASELEEMRRAVYLFTAARAPDTAYLVGCKLS